MTSTTTPAVPSYLQGNYAPVFDELTADDSPVSGNLPPRLEGVVCAQWSQPAQTVSRQAGSSATASSTACG